MAVPIFALSWVGDKVKLPEGRAENDGRAMAIRVKDGKVYTAGEIDYTPYYWVNKEKKELDYGKKDGWATGIVVE